MKNEEFLRCDRRKKLHGIGITWQRSNLED
jgi:hypothetical protein